MNNLFFLLCGVSILASFYAQPLAAQTQRSSPAQHTLAQEASPDDSTLQQEAPPREFIQRSGFWIGVRYGSFNEVGKREAIGHGGGSFMFGSNSFSYGLRALFTPTTRESWITTGSRDRQPVTVARDIGYGEFGAMIGLTPAITKGIRMHVAAAPSLAWSTQKWIEGTDAFDFFEGSRSELHTAFALPLELGPYIAINKYVGIGIIGYYTLVEPGTINSSYGLFLNLRAGLIPD